MSQMADPLFEVRAILVATVSELLPESGIQRVSVVASRRSI